MNLRRYIYFTALSVLQPIYRVLIAWHAKFQNVISRVTLSKEEYYTDICAVNNC